MHNLYTPIRMTPMCQFRTVRMSASKVRPSASPVIRSLLHGEISTLQGAQKLVARLVAAMKTPGKRLCDDTLVAAPVFAQQ